MTSLNRAVLPGAPYDIRSWDIGDDDFEINLRVNDKRFTISVSPDCFCNSPSALKEFHDIMHLLAAGNDDAADVWEYGERIADLFLPEFERLAPPVAHVGKLTLADLVSHGDFDCEFSVVDGKPVAGLVTPRIRDDDDHDDPLFGDIDISTVLSAFPVLGPDEVEVPYSNPLHVFDIIPQRVLVHGRHFFYKASWSLQDSIDAIKKYDKIATSGLCSQELRTPRLYAIVAYADNWIKGLLYEWIDVDSDRTLTWTVNSDTSTVVREKWAAQIKDTVAKLHDLGIIWGDVKSDNVLIDREDNAIVIDLDGGATRRWVDFDKAGTIEGDLQGLGRIMDFIFNDDSSLRCPSPIPDDEHDDSL